MTPSTELTSSIFSSKDTILASRRSSVESDDTLFDDTDLKSLLVRSKEADIAEEELWDDANDHEEDLEDERLFVRFNEISYSFNFRLGEDATFHVMAATTDNRTQVAIKVFSKHQMLYYCQDAPDIINEKNIMDRASDIPFVAHLLASFQDGKRPMYPISLRMVLRRLHASNIQLELSGIRLFAAQLLLALIGLHNHRPKAIAHRDIKLDNVLLTSQAFVSPISDSRRISQRIFNAAFLSLLISMTALATVVVSNGTFSSGYLAGTQTEDATWCNMGSGACGVANVDTGQFEGSGSSFDEDSQTKSIGFIVAVSHILYDEYPSLPAEVARDDLDLDPGCRNGTAAI
ncbi:hypothetical protein C8J56DRAFT_888470 [Mycena floridula]|nr:hypothetical protein C8J56DRAFT_888470 [Mycena floridula]